MSQTSRPVRDPAGAPAGRVIGARRWLRPFLAVPTPVIFVTAALIATWLLWRQGSLANVAASLRSVSAWQVVGILIVYALSILILGFRWHVLVRLAGGDPAWTSSAEVFLTSVIVNYAAPIGLAVPTRAALTVRDLGLPPVQSAAVVGWELALDVLALLGLSGIWLALGGMGLLGTVSIDQGLLVVAIGAAVLGMVALGAISRIATIRERIVSLLGPMVARPAQRPALAFVATVLTILFWLLQSGVMAALLQVFGVSPTIPLVAGLMGLPVLIGMLSPVPGGAGVREALMAAAARLDGVPGAPVILAAVAYRLALFVVTPLVWAGLRLARGRGGRR